MLVLSRKTDELIQIGEDVTVQVLKVKGRQVKLGIVAPDQVRVFRAELSQEFNQESDQEPQLNNMSLAAPRKCR